MIIITIVDIGGDVVVVVVGEGDGVGRRAICAYLSLGAREDPQLAHLDHGQCELPEEERLVGVVAQHSGVGAPV